MVDDWITHTPKDILAKNFGVNASVFSTVPSPNPYIINATISNETVSSPYGKLDGNSSYTYHASQKAATKAAGGGGTIQIVDSTNFPVAKTIAAAIVHLEPGALRELHWHPNVSQQLQIGTTANHHRLKSGSTLRPATPEQQYSLAVLLLALSTFLLVTRQSSQTTLVITSSTPPRTRH